MATIDDFSWSCFGMIWNELVYPKICTQEERIEQTVFGYSFKFSLYNGKFSDHWLYYWR